MIEQCFQIGEFFLDPANRLLRYGEAPVSLSPKAFDALVYLVRNPGRLLTRDELMQALWPDSYVEEGNLSVHIFQVRRALGREPQPVRLMRVSSVEGFPQFVLQTSGYSEWGLRFECARRPRGSCVLAQRDGSEIVFRRFDSEHGIDVDRSEILRVPLGANLQISWTLSPDGSHLGWIVSDAPDATIHVVSLRESGSGREGQVVLKDVSHLHALNWSPEGEGWFVTTRLPASWEILHATEARTDVLWRGQGEYSPEAWPSPDGRHLAFSQEEQDSNVWMMEDF